MIVRGQIQGGAWAAGSGISVFLPNGFGSGAGTAARTIHFDGLQQFSLEQGSVRLVCSVHSDEISSVLWREMRPVIHVGGAVNIAGKRSFDAEGRRVLILGSSVEGSEADLRPRAVKRRLSGRAHTRVERRAGADNECKVKSHLALAQMKAKERRARTRDDSD